METQEVTTPPANADAGQVVQPDASAPEAGTKAPALKPEAAGQANDAQTSQPAFDVQKSYDELRKQFTRVTQDYSKDRKTWQQTLTELQALKQAHAQTAEQLSKAMKTPIDPVRFYEDFKTQGPKVFDGYVNERIQDATKQLQEAYTEQANTALLLETKLEKLHRRMDTKNYPDFAELEPLMEEIAGDDKTPIDWNQPIGVVYDTLYKLARSRSSENAVKAAEEFGAKRADEAARKEAATTVPGSGKGGAPTTDPRKMTASQLRQHFISQGMVEEE